jgi:hypothetical protein
MTIGLFANGGVNTIIYSFAFVGYLFFLYRINKLLTLS